jgi:type II secretory pathway pseudopilin PulG
MIAQRFKAVGWVAIVALAATFLYLISLQVAVERGKLEAVESQIRAAQREVRQLQTEMGTRASLRQLERWNGDVLALSAPKASQFVNNGTQLVALNLDGDAHGTPNAPPPVMASIAVPKPVDVTVPSIPDEPLLKTVAATVAKAKINDAAKVKIQQVAMVDVISPRDAARITAIRSPSPTAKVESRKRP